MAYWLLTAAALAGTAAQSPLDAFQAPRSGMYAATSDLAPATSAPNAAACAQRCLTDFGAACISFNLCINGTSFACGCQGWSMGYDYATASQCSYYRRITPRNDTAIVQAIRWILSAPDPRSVTLRSGPLQSAFQFNVDAYLKIRDPLDMLYFFAKRSGANNSGKCWGWGGWIEGSEAGNYLMGAGSALTWIDDAFLHTNVQEVVDGIAKYRDPATGWLWAFNETLINGDNYPDYCAAWVTRGLLAAAESGLITGARDLARQSISTFNNHTLLPFFLPANSGPHPAACRPSGFNNVSNGGYGQATGHCIYMQNQGMIKHTLMALSGDGTQADVDTATQLYQEDWWLSALLDEDLFHAIWHRQFFSHNYEVTAFEALLDLYVITGNTTYLNATLKAWKMLREHWILPGGSFALNEGSYYAPDSYYIGFTGTHVAAAHDHHRHGHGHYEGEEEAGSTRSTTGSAAAAAAAAADPYFHAPCMNGPGVSRSSTSSSSDNDSSTAAYVSPLVQLRAPAMQAATPPHGGPNDNDPPTGELCGSVFYTLFNQRFHRLFPENETFVAEMERSIFNNGLAALSAPGGSGGQGPNGTGIRYFQNQHKVKQYPSMHASCCEGQGTRLYGKLPEFIFSTLRGGEGGTVTAVYVDIYADATLAFQQTGGGGLGGLEMSTTWPYGDSSVALTLTLSAQSSAFDLALRIPYWAGAASVPITVNGETWPEEGKPGSYLHLSPWPAGTSTVSFSLRPMSWTPARYTGSSQLPPYARYSYLFGPVLMAFQGPWNSSVDALIMPSGLDPTAPGAWLTGNSGGSLHFSVVGYPNYTVKPYWEVQTAGELFSNYPCFL